MGAKDSKRSCLSYEDAVKRMTDAEFKRATGGAFDNRRLVVHGCGGSSRGIALRDLICGLVLLTKGTQEEKIKPRVPSR
ncbi:hypothetical protein NQ317_005054 [Molorchus minor]|uniref:Uncharacterized protein n=1 Tax=Molorchus minor TaxID=1323400 RepID=A0ABQ9JYZ3_9CUCU|nr:hypothetical protein NQ317_005054 [Molorchus minor]